MDTDFWLERWQNNQTGFHQDEINSYLTRYWSGLGLTQGSRVLVPLCGKSLDMLWLAEQGHSVVGIELSRLAIEAFFHENALTPEVHEEDRCSRYVHGNIELVCANFLSLAREDIGKIDAFFDRAALIALTPAQRPGYAARLAQLLPGDTPGLLITLDYQQHEMSGPPFAVSHNEVCQLFESGCTIDHLLQFNALEENARFSERGVTALTEHAYRLRRL